MYVLYWLSFIQMLLSFVDNVILNTLNQCISFSTSRFVKEMIIFLLTLFTNKLYELCFYNSDFIPQYISYNLTPNIGGELNTSTNFFLM